MALMNKRQSGFSGATTVRSLMLLGVVALGAWHLWCTLDVGSIVEDVADAL